MKAYRSRIIETLSLASLLSLIVPVGAAETWVTYVASPIGSKVKIDGTSTLGGWTMESQLVAGKMELEPGFELNSLKPGKLNARAQISIPVRSFKSGKDGLDQVMQQAMKADKGVVTNIVFRLTELTFKESPKAAEGLFQFESKGELAIAGVTNQITMPVTFLRVSPVRLKVSGSTNLKMTDYGVTPPAPKLAAGALTTGDDVKITFDWVVTKRSEPAKQ